MLQQRAQLQASRVIEAHARRVTRRRAPRGTEVRARTANVPRAPRVTAVADRDRSGETIAAGRVAMIIVTTAATIAATTAAMTAPRR